jgi:hypothetical protein
MSQIEKHTRCSNVISDIEKWGPNLKSQQPRQSNGSTGQSVTDKNMFSYESLCVCVCVCGVGGGGKLWDSNKSLLQSFYFEHVL